MPCHNVLASCTRCSCLAAWLAAAPKARQESCQHTEAITVPFPGSAPQRNGEALVEVRQTRQTRQTGEAGCVDSFVEAVALGTDHSYQAQELDIEKYVKFSHWMYFLHISWTYFECVCLCRWVTFELAIGSLSLRVCDGDGSKSLSCSRRIEVGTRGWQGLQMGFAGFSRHETSRARMLALRCGVSELAQG